MSSAVRPAATVVVLRPRSEAGHESPELFMLRRSSRSAFMPDALVFPGGRVEQQDEDGDGIPDTPTDAAFARAAWRECQEEANLELPLDALTWFDTWLTPSGESPRRFLARFYLTTIGPDQGHEAVADGEETHAGRWATASAILDQWRAEQVDLPPPTLSVLLGLAGDDWRSWLARPRTGLLLPILPKLAPIGNTLHIVMPHDPEYGALPGETSPAPARAHAYPRRFAREGKRWIPTS